jgi:hypothetical protein
VQALVRPKITEVGDPAGVICTTRKVSSTVKSASSHHPNDA